MTPASGTQVWQFAAVALAVAGSAVALACHVSPALRAWLGKMAGGLLRHRYLPATLRAFGSRLDAAASADASCDQGCGPCGGCGSRPSPRGPESTIAPPRSRRDS